MKQGIELFQSLPKIDFIKWDVEGFEVTVIGNLMPLIMKHTPVLLIECSGKNRVIIKQMMREAGYKAFVLINNTLEAEENFTASTSDILFKQ